MTRKPLDQNEFISALDFVKTDIDNLRAYFEHGAIDPTPAVMERALKLRVSIEMFVALFSNAPQSDANFSTAARDLMVQSQILAKQSAEVLQELKKAKEPIQSTILNEVLNVKEMLIKQGLQGGASFGNSLSVGSEIAQLKASLAYSIAELEQKLSNDLENQSRDRLDEYTDKMLTEIYRMQKTSNRGVASGEILGEIEKFKEEFTKQIAGVEKNIIENLETSKDEIIYSQKSDEILKSEKDNAENISQSIVLAKTSMQVLRGISKQLLGVYEAQKRSLADIEKAVAGVSYQGRISSGEDMELADGFAQLKEELQSISSIINFEEIEKISDTNQAIEIADSIANQAFEPEGLLQTARELEALATELSELEKSQAEREATMAELEETDDLSVLDNFEEETDELEKLDGKTESEDESETEDEAVADSEAETED
ncbi:MAG: hypothetical protein R3Y65_02815 [Bacillota bacterium]